MRYINPFKNFKLKRELKKFNIQNYTINEDGTIDVDGDVLFGLSELIKFNRLPFKFGRVSGNFECGSYHRITITFLKTLDGCPYYVGGNFICANNQLANLIGGPEEVMGNYICCNNKLTSLEGAPAEVGGDFDISHNRLFELNCSTNVGKRIFAHSNAIYPKRHVNKNYKPYYQPDDFENFDGYAKDIIIVI